MTRETDRSEAVAALAEKLHEQFCVELGFSNGYFDTDHAGSSTCSERAERLLAALRPEKEEAGHPHDGYAYNGCKCVCCTNVRALA